MNMKPPLSLKLLLLLLVAALALSSIAWYVGVYSPRSKAALGPNGATILFSPSSGTMPVGTDQTMTVTVAPVTSTEKISGIDMTFNAGGSMQIKDITAPANLPTQLVKTISATTGRISFVNSAPNDQLPATVQFNVVFSSTTAGTGTIQLDVAKSQIVGTVSTTVFDLGTDLTAITFTFNSNGGGSTTPTTGAGTVTPTKSPTPTVPSSGPTLNFNMKFQGITGLPSTVVPMPVQIKLSKNGAIAATGTVQMTPGTTGLWTGSMQIAAPAGSDYTLLVKGPRHLQKRICVNTPTETAIGTYRCTTGKVTLNNGANTFDLSGIMQLAGDLPNQDGTVDSYDTSYIRQSLGSVAANDLAVADINRDGVVDTQDMSLVIQALNVKYDEE